MVLRTPFYRFSMWKNIFIEACVLSLLVFGGFYINATFLKEKIAASEEKVLGQTLNRDSRNHISGFASTPPPGPPAPHLSGGQSPQPEKKPAAKESPRTGSR